jgi:hypothetical protein
VKTIIHTDNSLLTEYYIDIGICSVYTNQNRIIIMRFYEFASAIKQPLTPDQAKIQGMKNQVKNTQKAIKAEKARQKIKAGQEALAQSQTNQ